MKNLQIEISKKSSETILQQLIGSIQGLISANNLEEGDVLPSINGLSKQFNISRDTVFKAYQQLKSNGFVDSTPAKGYFVARKFNRILLVLDYYSPFKDAFHEAFKKYIPKDYIVDLVFHHYNKNLFDTVIQNAIGKYSFYIIMHYDTRKFAISKEVEQLNPEKLLLLDIPVKNWKSIDKTKVSYIFQDFDTSVFQNLQKVSAKLKKYQKLNVVHSVMLNHPGITVESIQRFCSENKMEYQLFNQANEMQLNKGEIYFVFRQKDLGKIIKQSQQQQFVLGEDIGIIAYNDAPLYEFIDKGITVISIDFEEMGRMAANFVTNSKQIKEKIKTQINIRGTL